MGEHITIGPLEPQFFGELCKRIGVSEHLRHAQYDRRQWPIIRDEFARIFSTRTGDEWTAPLEGSGACIAPVLHLSEAMRHPHHVARNAWVDVDSVPQPAPRFSRTPSSVQARQREPHALGNVLQRSRQA